MLDRPPRADVGGTGKLLGEQGIIRLKTKALLFVGTKETKGCC